MKLFHALFLALFIASLAASSTLIIKEPIEQKLSDFQTLDLGIVGPG